MNIDLNYIKHNITPYAVNKIGIYDSNNNLIGAVSIDNIKPTYKERLYRFGVLSDVHQNTNTKAEPGPDFENALKVFNEKESVNFTCICGDITENSNIDVELTNYKLYVNNFSPNTPVYTTTGNHDCGISTSDWVNYTGHNKTFKIDYNYNKDHFIFLGMSAWSLGSSGTPYSNEDIDQLESWLEQYKDDRCFVFTHLFFPERAGNFKYAYPSGNWLGGEQLERLMSLNSVYKNVYWFSGHSHWKWYLQQHQQNANVYGKQCAWNIHIPSCASPIDSFYKGPGLGNNGTAWSRESQYYESEGAIIDVYEDYIEVRGVSFKQNGNDDYKLLYIPCAQYRLTPGGGDDDIFTDITDEIDYSTVGYVKASDFIQNPEKNDVPVMPIDLDNNYIEVRFNNAKQGLECQPDNFIEYPSAIYLYVEDVQYYTAKNNNPSDLLLCGSIPSYVGFYGTSTHYSGVDQYSITTDFQVSTIDDGLDSIGRAPLQTSSKFVSSNDGYNFGEDENQDQLVIRMKIKLLYL